MQREQPVCERVRGHRVQRRDDARPVPPRHPGGHRPDQTALEHVPCGPERQRPGQCLLGGAERRGRVPATSAVSARTHPYRTRVR